MPLTRAELKPVIEYILGLKQKRAQLDAEIQQAELGLAAFTGSPSVSATRGNGRPKMAKATTKPGKKRRIRRTTEQLKGEAVKIFGFVRSAGQKGTSGKEIRARFPGVGIDIKGFMKKYGQPLKTTGKKSKMLYSA